MRHGDLFFVTSPLGDKFSIYDSATNKASTVRLPGSKESSLQVTPILSQGNLVSLMLNGPKITRLYLFSREDWKWYPQELKEPVAGTVSLIVGRSVAAYAQGQTIYAFSTEAKRWTTFELPEAPAQPGMSVFSDSIVFEFNGHIYEFSGKTGEWKHTDLRDVDRCSDQSRRGWSEVSEYRPSSVTHTTGLLGPLPLAEVANGVPCHSPTHTSAANWSLP